MPNFSGVILKTRLIIVLFQQSLSLVCLPVYIVFIICAIWNKFFSFPFPFDGPNFNL